MLITSISVPSVLIHRDCLHRVYDDGTVDYLRGK